MPKKGTTDLFRLIHSMEGAEKAYFKRFAQRHVIGKENKYVKLFDAVEKQKEYDEEKLLKEEKYVRQLPYLKNYLFNLILRSLENFHSRSTTELSLRNQINQIEILQQKGLFGSSEKLIARAKTIARKHDLFSFLFELNKLRYKIIWKNSDFDSLKKIMHEEKEQINIFSQTKSYRDLCYKIVALYNSMGERRSIDDEKEVEDLMKNPLLKNESNARNFESKLFFYQTHYVYRLIRGEYKRAYSYAKKRLEFHLTLPEKKEFHSATYFSCLNDLLNILFELKRFDEMRDCLEKLQSALKTIKSSDEKSKQWYRNYIHHLNYFNHSGDFSEGIKFVGRMEKEIKEHEKKLSIYQKAVLYINTAINHFGNGKYRQCLRCLNEIVAFRRKKIRTDMENFLKIFYLIVQYETGHEDIMPDLVKSNYRALFKQKRLFRFETVMLNFFKKTLPKIDAFDKKSKVNAFRILKSEVEQLEKNPYEKIILNAFDFISWIDSKIQGHSFAEIVKEKEVH